MPIVATARCTNRVTIAAAFKAYLFLFARFGQAGPLFAASGANEDKRDEYRPARDSNGVTHGVSRAQKRPKIPLRQGFGATQSGETNKDN